MERQEAVIAEPAQIRIIEGSHIGDSVFQHRHPLDSHAKGKALIFGRVDAAVFQYLRVDHAAAEDLEPIASGPDLELAALARATDVHLGRGFGEWEIARAKAYRQVVEPALGPEGRDQAARQLALMGGSVHHQPPALMTLT